MTLCYISSWMAFKTKYSDCRHNFGRIRPVDRSQGLGKKIYFRGKDFCIYHMFKTNFSEHNKIWGTKMFEGNCPRMYPMSAGLGRTVAEKSSIVGLRVCAVGL